MYKILDIENWNRKEHFEFFSKYDEPFWGVVSEVDVTKAYTMCKEKKYSFFSYYLHKSIKTINETEEFRYRIIDEQVVIYDIVHTSATIAREDGTFAFSFAEYHPDFNIFDKSLKAEIKAVKSSVGLRNKAEFARQDVVYYSSLPWAKFTGLTHATNFNDGGSVPKITFGKMFERTNRNYMAVALNAHHGLADGLHAAKYFELFQELLNKE